MTTAAGNAFLHVRAFVQLCSRHGMEWRMTNSAARILRWIADLERLGNAARAGGGQRRVGAGMEIEFRPNRVLMSIVACAAMTTG